MALAAATGLAQFDVIGVREDLSDVVAAILLSDTNLLSRIGMGGVATNVKHEWLESSLNPATVVDNESGGLDAAGTNVDLDLVTDSGVYVRVGSLLRDKARGKTEVLQVTAVSTDALTITRGYGSTSPEVHASGATWQIIGNPKQSGADVSDDVSTLRSRVYNYCQIFERGIKVAGDAQAVNKAGVPDEMAEQARQRLTELMVELDMAVVAGIISSSGGSDSVYRSMKGLIEFLSAAGGNADSTAEALDLDVLNDLCQNIYDDGGMPNVLALNQVQQRKISAFDADKVRVTPDVRVAGRYVTQILTDLGFILDIVVDRNIPPDTIMILDTTRIKVVPMQNRAFGIEPIPKTGDALKTQLLGDYTLEVRNATQAHAIHTNLAL